MLSAESGAGLRYLSRWALLQARLLDLICGHTMRGSSTRITCSSLELICLYVTLSSFPSRAAVAGLVYSSVNVYLKTLVDDCAFLTYTVYYFKHAGTD